jgi:hypothetical protein
MGDWTAFLQVQAGASASLLGLVFVGLSINFTRIIDSSHLPNRALEALIILLLNLVVASLLLVPGQAAPMLGNEVLGLALLVWIWVTYLHVQNLRRMEARHRPRSLWGLSLGQITILSWCAGGLMLLTRGAMGLAWLVPCFLLGYLLALLNAWVLLVEINR